MSAGIDSVLQAAIDAGAVPNVVLGGGTLDEAKILERATVEDMFRNHIGELEFPPEIRTADPGSTADFNAGPGFKWAGIFNTHFWVDPASGVTARSTPRRWRSWSRACSRSPSTSSARSTPRSTPTP